jgi:hypothetical protein
MAEGYLLICLGFPLLLPPARSHSFLVLYKGDHRNAADLSKDRTDKAGICQEYYKALDDTSQCSSFGHFYRITSPRLRGISQDPALDMLVSHGMCQPRLSRKEKERNVVSTCSG